MKTVTLQAVNHPNRPAGEIYEAGGRELLEDIALKRSIPYLAAKIEPPRQKRRYRRRDMQAE